MEDVARRVWRRYVESESAEPVASVALTGGFSGALNWRITGRSASYCLRRWPPEHPDADRLASIHRLLRQVAARGVHEVAVPIPDRTGKTFTFESGFLWELNPWMPGSADYSLAATRGKLAAAMQLLARFHLAAGSAAAVRWQLPPGLLTRTNQLRQLAGGGFEVLHQVVRQDLWPELADIATPSLHCMKQATSQVMRSLEVASQERVPIQSCIRDVWHDHILFTGERVTGLIDFGALRDDHVACDISRLLGSLVQDDPAGWAAGLEAYDQVRRLTHADRHLVQVYDQSAVLLSVANWLQWLYLEQRAFDDRTGVTKRFRSVAARLKQLAGQTTSGP